MLDDKLHRSEQLKKRTKQFGLRVIRMFQKLPKTDEARVIGRQVLRSGTAVGANYRAACRARTPREFVAKVRIVLEEADESVYWLELLVEAGIVPQNRMDELLSESEELLAIFAASLRTADGRQRQNQVSDKKQ